VSLAGPGAHVSFIGIPVPDVTFDNAVFQAFLRQEVSLHGSWNSFGAPFPGKQWSETVAALSDGRLKWEFLISHDLDLAELPKIFDQYKAGTLSYSKVMFRP
jgi:L-iditol 2-dehydrogenase